MIFNDLYNSNEHLLIKCISGSQAYGLQTNASDTDIRGIFIQPKNTWYGLPAPDQYADDKNDIVYYELQKVVQLLLKNNPNILELINTPKDSILYKHPLMQLFTPELFLSKLCLQSFAGYAFAQIDKAQGLNKKIMNPMDEQRKGLLDFCWVAQSNGSILLADWLAQQNISINQCGISAIEHMKNCYHLYVNKGKDDVVKFKGIIDKDNVQLVLSSIPKQYTAATLIYCNIEGFQKYCTDYTAYWQWVKNRNQVRYQANISNNTNYDTKNMMHTFRLLNMAYEIATEHTINVHRPDKDFLLNIRNATYSYDTLIAMANDKLQIIKEAFASSTLPNAPNINKVEEILIGVREEWYANKNE
jgi:uncharacterized protein